MSKAAREIARCRIASVYEVTLTMCQILSSTLWCSLNFGANSSDGELPKLPPQDGLEICSEVSCVRSNLMKRTKGEPPVKCELAAKRTMQAGSTAMGGDIWQKGVSSMLAIPVGISEYE